MRCCVAGGRAVFYRWRGRGVQAVKAAREALNHIEVALREPYRKGQGDGRTGQAVDAAEKRCQWEPNPAPRLPSCRIREYLQFFFSCYHLT